MNIKKKGRVDSLRSPPATFALRGIPIDGQPTKGTTAGESTEVKLTFPPQSVD